MANDYGREQKRVIKEAQKRERTLHFATLMDISHLKNAELVTTFLKNKGRVVLEVSLSKDDSGPNEVFTEPGSSASQMRRTSSQCSIILHPSQNGRCPFVIETSHVRMSRYLDTSVGHKWPKIMVQH